MQEKGGSVTFSAGGDPAGKVKNARRFWDSRGGGGGEGWKRWGVAAVATSIGEGIGALYGGFLKGKALK